MASPAPHLVDGILEEIFLRLPTPAALARASIACPRFRRIITGRNFLRLFRKRARPPLLGFADQDGSFHPSTRLGRAFAEAADFTYSFVPKPQNEAWRPCDVRDGRVLLQDGRARWCIFTNLAVCDPLSRRYLLLPPISSGDLAMASQLRPLQINPVLAPIGEDDTSFFKVMCFADYQTELAAFVFSSVTREWCVAASASWSSLGGRPHGCQLARISGHRGVSCFDYVRGRFYSASLWVDRLLVLDTRTFQFSTVSDRTGYHAELRRLPGQPENSLASNSLPHRRRPGQFRSLPRIVVGRQGALEMFSLLGDHSPGGSFDLHHTSQQNNGGEASQDWQLQSIIPLPGQYDYFTVGAAEGFLFLGATTEDQLDIAEPSLEPLATTDWDVDYFSLEVETYQLNKICTRKRQFFHYEDVYCYFGFPPWMSEPTI